MYTANKPNPGEIQFESTRKKKEKSLEKNMKVSSPRTPILVREFPSVGRTITELSQTVHNHGGKDCDSRDDFLNLLI